jgi:hypothetical protein
VIPAEAVEAAAKALRESRLNGRQGLGWEQLDSAYQDEFRKSASAALEASATCIRAQALEDAATAQGERVTAIEQTLVDEYQYDTLCAMREQANQDLIWLTERAAADRTAL